MVFSHCTAALARFWQTQVVPTRPEGDFEFLSHTARPMWKPVTKVAVTPRKYEIGAFCRVSFSRVVCGNVGFGGCGVYLGVWEEARGPRDGFG